MNKKFTGVYPVPITPFKENGEFDFEAGKKHVDYLIDAGVHGLCILGATGEYQSVTLAEHMEYAKEMVLYVGKRVPVIVGCTREMPDEAVMLAKNALGAGADAVMILPTYYCHPCQDEIYNYYKYIAEHINGGTIMIYNNPGSAGVEIERETFKKLMMLEQVKIVKESSGNIRTLTNVLNNAPEDVSVFCGWDDMSYESFACGAVGWISVLANLAPRQCVGLFETVHTENNHKKARMIYQELLPYLTALESVEKPVQTVKYVMDLKDQQGGYSRRPRIGLTEKEKKEAEELFDLRVLY